MNLAPSKQPKKDIIRSFFSAIKKDDIDKVKKILDKEPSLINIKNAQREGLLFYAFEKNIKKVIDFLTDKYPNLITEKNIINLNIIHKLISKNINIEYFLEKMAVLSPSEIEQIYKNTDPQGNNLLMFAAKSGRVDSLRSIFLNCPNFQELVLSSNHYGQTVAHFMASNINEDCPDIIKKLPPNLMKKLDNLNGFSPLMLAAYYQTLNNFEAFYELMPGEQTSLTGGNLMHFAASNSNSKLFKFLIKNGLFTNKKSATLQTPLNTAIQKGFNDIVELIVVNVQNEGVCAEDLIASARISSKRPDLFRKIIVNKNNERLTQNDEGRFLESLFLYANHQTVLEVLKMDEYKNCLNFNDFSILFPKALAGKKDMISKTNFLLERDLLLSTQEVIVAANALDKLPNSQINFILKNSDLLSKCEKEDLTLFKALCLSRGLDHSFIQKNEYINDDEEFQKAIGKFLKYSKIQNSQNSTTHLKNIKEWLSILADKKVAWKHYGYIASKHREPFDFLQNSFKILPRENMRDLVYYTITALFKNKDELSSNTIRTINQAPNLLANVFAGVIKFGKIPENQQLLSCLPQVKQKALRTEELSSFLKRTRKKQRSSIDLLKNTIQIFDLDKIHDMEDFCNALMTNQYSYEIIPKVLNQLDSQKDNFKITYAMSYVKNKNLYLDLDIAKEMLINHSQSEKVIKEVLLASVLEDSFADLDFIKKIHEIDSNKILNSFNLSQELLEQGRYDACFKIQKVINKKMEFKKLNFSKVDWKQIDLKLDQKDPLNNFFDFIESNKDSITEKQLDVIARSLLESIKKNEISFETIEQCLSSLDGNLSKISEDVLIGISSYVLKKHQITNIMKDILSKDNFDNIFSLISKTGKVEVFEKLKQEDNFELIQKETRIVMNNDILQKELPIKNLEAPKPKRIKI